MTAAIWSCPPDKAGLNFPAFTLLKFMHNHHLLQILDRPTWLTLKNGSHSYVNAILDNVPENQKHLNTKIVSVSTNEAKGLVTVRSDKGVEWEFDHVVFATHADTTLSILKQGGNKDGSGGITKDEKDVLSGFEFGENRAVLHADVAVGGLLGHWSELTPAVDAQAPSDLVRVELPHRVGRPSRQRQLCCSVRPAARLGLVLY